MRRRSRARAAVLLEPGQDPQLTDIELRDPVGDEVLVRIDAVGICHTDITMAAIFSVKTPMVFAARGRGGAVNSATGEIRIRRMLAVCASGRILNPVTARSQVRAMTMVSGRAHGGARGRQDPRVLQNHDLAGYEVPVHADIPHQDVIFLDEIDPDLVTHVAMASPSLASAGGCRCRERGVQRATGVRVRDYPITLDKLLDGLPAA